LDDLLGDNDESSKKITNETSELANMSNQIGILRNQMQDVQSKKTTTEADLANTNNQKRDLELRLGQFRTQYEQEARAVKELDEQLTAVRNDTRRIQQDLALLEAGYQDLQTQHRQAAAALDNERRENATLKERIRVINAEVAQLKPQLEQLQKDTRGEKGRVSINKKEVERSEAARDSVKAEIDDLSRSVPEAKNVPLPEAASDLASPAASTASAKGNPFFRKSPQPSFDNSMSPGGFGQQSRGAPGKDSPNITNIFGPSFGGTPVTSPPATSFRSDPFPTEPSVTSSEPGLPTPSASPHPSEAPPPPASRQITSNDLPLPGPRPDTAASSVRVETPTSRISGLETPTNPGSASPAPAVNDRPYASRQDTQSSTGVAIFDRAASPVASVTSNASRGGKSINQDFFSTFPTSSAPIPGAFPEPTPMEANKTGESAFSDRSKQSTPFGFPGRQDTSKSDFDSAFASVGGPKVPARQGSSHGEAGPPKKKFESEFPPIETHEGPDSDSDEDAQGFGDSFTTASPPRQKGAGVNEPKEAVGGSSFFGSQPPASELPRPDAQKSPPSYNTAAGGSGRVGSQDFPSEFGGLLPSRENPLSSPTQEAQSPSVGTRGDALFGGSSKTASAAPTSTFSTFSASPPPTSGTPASTTGTHSDAFHSAPTHPNTERDSSSTQKSHGGFNDDFDADFDALGPERGDDDGGDDDFVFGSGSGARGQDDEWNPHFDSPAASKTGTMHSERTPTGTAGQSKSSGFDDFDAFGSGFSNKPAGAGQSSTLGNSAITDTSKDEWEDMFSSISGAGKDSNAGIKGFDENEPFGSSSAGGVGGPPAAPEVPSFPEAPEAPEAPMPPKLGRTVTESSVHDVDDVKKLVKMGFPRQLVVSALEKYDYDFNKVSLIVPKGKRKGGRGQG
jgi:epidermal growth factor receptor substrate 15